MSDVTLSGLHILLTYQCTFECDHCFVWGSPWQNGTFSLAQLSLALKQAQELHGLEEIYFEGGEPFLYYPTLVKAVEMAAQMGFRVGIVSNAYWAVTLEDALEWLRPFAGKLVDLSVSSDTFHYNERDSRQARNAVSAAQMLGIPIGVISVAPPTVKDASQSFGVIATSQEEEEGSAVMYRGRAAVKLVQKATPGPWQSYNHCPHEDLHSPGRVHLDPLGFIHLCQGIVLGNIFEQSLAEIWQAYQPGAHPILGPLLAGGPALLTERYEIPHSTTYADACHLCYETRLALRSAFPNILTPDQMYGIYA
jgi:MoaA/NifB/PqqE/SkfB family radical SAM enzyme